MLLSKKGRLRAATWVAPLAAALDRAVTRAVSAPLATDSARTDDLELLEYAQTAAELMEARTAQDFFQPPRPIHPFTSAMGRGPLLIHWRSHHAASCPIIGQRYSSYTDNSVSVAHMLCGTVPRPVAVLIHGYMGGSLGIEQRVWPVAWLNSLGFDVAFFTLPFHGPRKARQRHRPIFPQADIHFNIEGFRQSVTDLRDLVHWLKGRGHPRVGLMGMSLGGYVAALTATVEPGLSFLVPIVPLACLADFAREQGRVPRGTQSATSYLENLRRAYRLVSPLHRSPQIEPERVLVVAGKADRITPPEHARAMARHFSAPIEAWPGGHLLQFGRGKSLDRVGRLLRSACSA